MKNFFKNLLRKANKEVAQPAPVPLSETQMLEILGKAIRDLGYWNWWATSLPKVIQIEFGRTLLYFPPADSSQPPQTKIAVQFINPQSISFLTRLKTIGDQWFDDLHNDKLDPPACSHEAFTFTDKARMSAIIREAATIHTIHGYSPKEERFLTENYQLVFWAGDYGFAVASEKIALLTQDRDVELDEIPSLHSEWWAYWRRYWDLKKTETPLPRDFACEVTIPLGKTD